MAKRKDTAAARDAARKDVAQNRRARHEYEIVETVEAGMVLEGSEVKALRERGATIADAYVQLRGGEAWLVGAHIPEYHNAGMTGHDPQRTRKLLLHRREIEGLGASLQQKGLALVPLRLYFRDGRAKMELGLGRGKTLYDKRRTLVERDARREAERAMKVSRRR